MLDLTLIDLTHHLAKPLNITDTIRPHPTQPITCIESPALIFRSERTIDKFPPDSFVKVAVILELAHKKRQELIDDEDLEAAEEGAGVALREGEIVILRTGWEKYSSNSRRYRIGFPTLSKNAVDYLLFKRISGVGVDSPNIDQDRKLSAHRALLREGVLVIENLCNLDSLDESRFQLIALPLKLRAGRSPARVIGILG
ncbi:MAG: cyclase family protein [Candidatus Bathyarchaeia archaeon]|jgi:kynurenine formamidase